MSCSTLITVQIGNSFYTLSGLPQVRHAGGQNGNTASFKITLPTGTSKPSEGSLVSIVFNNTTKLFGGLAARIKPIQYRPNRIYQVDCVDFTAFTRYKTFSYDSQSEENLEYHLTQILRLGGGTQPTNIEGIPGVWTIERLNYVIQQPSNPIEGIDPDIDLTEFRFAVQAVKLDQVLTQLCSQAGFRWSVDFGSWLRVDLIEGAVTNIANVILTRVDYSPTTVSFTIRPDGGGTCSDKQKWSKLSTDFQAPDVTRVIVAKDAESFALASNAIDTSVNHVFTIGADDERTQYQMLPKMDQLDSFQIIY